MKICNPHYANTKLVTRDGVKMCNENGEVEVSDEVGEQLAGTPGWKRIGGRVARVTVDTPPEQPAAPKKAPEARKGRQKPAESKPAPKTDAEAQGGPEDGTEGEGEGEGEGEDAANNDVPDTARTRRAPKTT